MACVLPNSIPFNGSRQFVIPAQFNLTDSLLQIQFRRRRFQSIACQTNSDSPATGLLLFANAFAIMNEERFLAPRGWSMSEIMAGGRRKSIKDQVVGLIYAALYMRIPLIILNVVTIVVKLLTG